MSIRASRTNIVLRPDPSRVFFRPFDLDSHERITRVVARVTALERGNAEQEAMIMLDRFMERHVKLKGFFLRRFEEVREHVITDRPLSEWQKLLIGAYFTLEYSLEAAALFNPSIVPHPDQTGLSPGALRFVLSLRATGEGHVSSIVFRTGMVDVNGEISINPPTRFVTAAEVQPNPSYEKRLFERKLRELGVLSPDAQHLMDQLGEQFTFEQLTAVADEGSRGMRLLDGSVRRPAEHLLAVARANYEISFEPSERYSERVIFPVVPAGYVPNVVYSCGALVHAGRLILPYAMSDQCTSFATVPMDELLSELKAHPPDSLL